MKMAESDDIKVQLECGKDYDVVAHISENGGFSVNLLLVDYEKQIRRKVIEEVLDIIKNISLTCGSSDNYDCIGHCEKCDCAVVETYEIDDLIKEINQLKEQTE